MGMGFVRGEALAKEAKVYCRQGAGKVCSCLLCCFFPGGTVFKRENVGGWEGGLTVHFILCLPTSGALMRPVILGLRMPPDPWRVNLPFTFFKRSLLG